MTSAREALAEAAATERARIAAATCPEWPPRDVPNRAADYYIGLAGYYAEQLHCARQAVQRIDGWERLTELAEALGLSTPAVDETTLRDTSHDAG